MPDTRRKPLSRGSAAAYASFVLYIASIGLGAAYHWAALDLSLAALTIAAMAMGSIVVLWRAFKHRKKPGGVRLGQMAALPDRWQKWVLGEPDDDRPDDASRRRHGSAPHGR